MATHLNEPTTPKTPKAAAPPRSVTIIHGEGHHGRLPIAVTVIPLADLDAKGGVFADFRMGAKGPDESAVERSSALEQGDKAVAAMVAKEAAGGARPNLPAVAESEMPEAPLPELDAAAAPAMAAEADPAKKAVKQPIVSHQIAKSIKLTVGQAETFRAEVAIPVASVDPSQRWYVRGRFSTLGGKDLTSAWLPI